MSGKGGAPSPVAAVPPGAACSDLGLGLGLGLVGVVQPARPPDPAPPPAARHYKKARRTLANAAASTTVPCTSRSVGTETGWAVGTFIRDRTADTGVPGPR